MRGKRAKQLRRLVNGDLTDRRMIKDAQPAVWIGFPKQKDNEGVPTGRIDQKLLKKVLKNAPSPIKYKTVNNWPWVRVSKGVTAKLSAGTARSAYQHSKQLYYGGVA